jgi:hypothetical protein
LLSWSKSRGPKTVYMVFKIIYHSKIIPNPVTYNYSKLNICNKLTKSSINLSIC